MNKKRGEEREINNPYMSLYTKKGLVIGRYKNVVIDKKAAMKIVADRKVISDNKCVPILVDIRGSLKITKEARDYFGSDEGFELLVATALLVDNSITSYLANFLIKVNFKKAKFPMRVYSNHEKAENWLKSFL